MAVAIGDKVRDRITGFEGVITGYVHYISGCDQVLVAPRVKEDGSAISSQWFDDDRVDIVEAQVAKVRDGKRGSDLEAPIR